MRLADLSRETGVSTATLKYYLREGLLHPGAPQSQTKSSYDDSHVARVRLVRALVTSGGLSLARAKSVVDAVDSPPDSRHDLLGVAQHALAPSLPGEPPEQWVTVARDFIEQRGWTIEEDDPLIAALAQQLEALVDSGAALGDGTTLAVWADALEEVAAADLATLPESPADALRQVVVGTMLTDPILLTLRRLAQQHASAERFAGRPGEARG